MKTNTTTAIATLILLCNGCCCFPFLYPRTGAHGVVLDQKKDSVPNVRMQARWVKPSALFHFMRPQSAHNFSSDSEGKWVFYTRDAEHMYIEATPPAGYNYALREDRVRATYLGPLRNGECPTNDVILRMIKIETTPNPKEAK